jgi:hypothetical protein
MPLLLLRLLLLCPLLLSLQLLCLQSPLRVMVLTCSWLSASLLPLLPLLLPVAGLVPASMTSNQAVEKPALQTRECLPACRQSALHALWQHGCREAYI